MKSGPVRFFCAVFSAAWILWIASALLYEKGLIGEPLYSVLFQAGTFAPSVLGAVFALLEAGGDGLSAVLRSAFSQRRSWGRAQILTLLVPFFALLPAGAALLFAGRRLSGDVQIWTLPLVFAYILFLGGPLAEELGWRGYALPRLLGMKTPLYSAVILGGIWALWHLPLFFIEGKIQHELFLSLGAAAALAGYGVYTVLVSVLITAVFLRSGNSVFFAILAHAVCNFSAGVWFVLFENTGIGVYFACFAAAVCVAAFAERKLLLKKSAMLSPSGEGSPGSFFAP